MKRCPFCDTVMNDTSRGGIHAPEWTCPTCECVEGYGLEQLPNPDALRAEAEHLEQLAEEIETTELAMRINR